MHAAGPILLLILLASPASAADPQWSFTASTGSALNGSTDLEIRQAGEPRLSVSADYMTRPFADDAPYYSLRIARTFESRGWEVELLHHKIYLTNPPEEVQRFEVSHGYNFILVNRAVTRRALVVRIGAGAVVTHAETTIRGRPWPPPGDDGYEVAGAGVQAALSRGFSISERVAVPVELKLTAASARVTINGGTADAPNVAIHALVGIELRR